MTWDDVEIALSPEQAVLAEVIRRCEQNGHRIGRTALQKIPYFLERQGVPLQYSFDLYHYGPFCEDILHDARLLESLNVTADDRDGYNGGSRYRAGHLIEEYLQPHREFIERNSTIVDRVVRLLAPLDATTLEVVATLDYFYRYVSAMELPEPRKGEVLRRFFEAKPQHKDKKTWVGEVYDQMMKIGMVGA